MLAAMHQYIGGQRHDSRLGQDVRRPRPQHERDGRDRHPGGPRRRGCRGRRGGHGIRGVVASDVVERSTVLLRAAQLLDERAEELARSRAGRPASRSASRASSTSPAPSTTSSSSRSAARHLEGKATAEYSGDHTSSIRREPIGVVGSIAPWNYPLQMAAWKILPAIAAGNTIVLKPAEITPLTSLLFAEAFTDAGAPAGVVNVVAGTGPVAGEHLVRPPRRRDVSFTGSTARRPPRHGSRRRQRQARPPRARRQGAVRGVRRRRPRRGRPRCRRRHPHQRRPGLHRGHPGRSCTARVYDDFVAGVADLMAAVRMGRPTTRRPTSDR